MHSRWMGLARDADGAAVPALPGYADAFALAREMAGDALEEAAYQRAIHGVLMPVYQRGVLVGYVPRYSDGLLTEALRANRPDKWKPPTRSESTIAITGAGGGPVRVETINLHALTDAQLLAMGTRAGGIPTLPGGLLADPSDAASIEGEESDDGG